MTGHVQLYASMFPTQHLGTCLRSVVQKVTETTYRAKLDLLYSDYLELRLYRDKMHFVLVFC
jgi:hypothetical protein